jgi:hypothetical protein
MALSIGPMVRWSAGLTSITSTEFVVSLSSVLYGADCVIFTPKAMLKITGSTEVSQQYLMLRGIFGAPGDFKGSVEWHHRFFEKDL